MDLRDHVLKQRHPWEIARFDAVCDVLNTHMSDVSTVMDFGAGDAWFATSLARRFSARPLTVDCVDIVGPTSSEYLGQSLIRRMQSPDPLAPRYDLLCLLDVLEHLPSDAETLTNLVKSHTHAGSRVMITVPAWPSLWSSHDSALGHYRRYTKKSIAALVLESGLTLERQGGWFYTPMAARAVTVAFEHIRGASDSGHPHSNWKWGPRVTRTVEALLRQDVRLSNLISSRVSVPGLSWWGICKL